VCVVICYLLNAMIRSYSTKKKSLLYIWNIKPESTCRNSFLLVSNFFGLTCYLSSCCMYLVKFFQIAAGLLLTLTYVHALVRVKKIAPHGSVPCFLLCYSKKER
jgi:hypothetical protein